MQTTFVFLYSSISAYGVKGNYRTSEYFLNACYMVGFGSVWSVQKKYAGGGGDKQSVELIPNKNPNIYASLRLSDIYISIYYT